MESPPFCWLSPSRPTPCEIWLFVPLPFPTHSEDLVFPNREFPNPIPPRNFYFPLFLPHLSLEPPRPGPLEVRLFTPASFAIPLPSWYLSVSVPPRCSPFIGRLPWLHAPLVDPQCAPLPSFRPRPVLPMLSFKKLFYSLYPHKQVPLENPDRPTSL